MIAKVDSLSYGFGDLNPEPERKKVSSCPPPGTLSTFCSIFYHDSSCCSFHDQRRYVYKSWDNVDTQEMAEYEMALIAFLCFKLDREAHRATFNLNFGQFKGDVLGTTLHNMVNKGILREVINKRYQLVPHCQIK